MKRITHNKLIRDLVPDKIATAGDMYAVRALSAADFVVALKKKVQEEAAEVAAAETRADFLSEYTDLMVVLDALTAFHEISEAELRVAMAENVSKKGLFTKRLFLEWTEDQSSE